MIKRMIIGEYDKNGYSIMTASGEVLHEAGANIHDSSAPGQDVPLKTIRKWCIGTGKEIAKENNAVWGGAEKK